MQVLSSRASRPGIQAQMVGFNLHMISTSARAIGVGQALVSYLRCWASADACPSIENVKLN